MSAASIIIIICGGVAWFTYRRIKQFPIIAIQGAFQRADYQHALEPVSYTHLDVYKRQSLC